MKSNMRNIVFALILAWSLSSCQMPGGNSPGSEYMPDMAHSIAYESNYYGYYRLNTWGSPEQYHELAQPRKPVEGTIARGYAGDVTGQTAGTMISPNGAVPYYYGESEEERQRAMDEIQMNPYPITGAGLAKGKQLYDVFCGICHGASGNSQGYLVSEDNPNAVYPAQPANFLTDEFIAASPGRYYHAIMHGRNLMGAYAEKLNYEERWNVIHYMRSLQAKEKGLKYNEEENTLNNYAIPASQWSGTLSAAEGTGMPGQPGTGSSDTTSVQGEAN